MTSISFILPYYRLGRKLLDRAVDSILNARLACDYEIIVVDDGTPDSEASQWLDGKSSRLRYVWQENGGLSAARNKGIEMAEKEYVQFLDADDYLFADGLRQVEKLLEEEHPDVVVFRRHKKVYGEGVTDVRQRRLKTDVSTAALTTCRAAACLPECGAICSDGKFSAGSGFSKAYTMRTKTSRPACLPEAAA